MKEKTRLIKGKVALDAIMLFGFTLGAMVNIIVPMVPELTHLLFNTGFDIFDAAVSRGLLLLSTWLLISLAFYNRARTLRYGDKTPEENVVSNDHITYLDMAGPSGIIMLPGFITAEIVMLLFDINYWYVELLVLFTLASLFSLFVYHYILPALGMIEEYEIPERSRGIFKLSGKAIHIQSKAGKIRDIKRFGLLDFLGAYPVEPDWRKIRLEGSVNFCKKVVDHNGKERIIEDAVTADVVTASFLTQYDVSRLIYALNVGDPKDQERGGSTERIQMIAKDAWRIVEKIVRNEQMVAYTEYLNKDGDLETMTVSQVFSFKLDGRGTELDSGDGTLQIPLVAATLELGEILVDCQQSPQVIQLKEIQAEINKAKGEKVVYNHKMEEGMELARKMEGLTPVQQAILASEQTGGRVEVDGKIFEMEQLEKLVVSVVEKAAPLLTTAIAAFNKNKDS